MQITNKKLWYLLVANEIHQLFLLRYKETGCADCYQLDRLNNLILNGATDVFRPPEPLEGFKKFKRGNNYFLYATVKQKDFRDKASWLRNNIDRLFKELPNAGNSS